MIDWRRVWSLLSVENCAGAIPAHHRTHVVKVVVRRIFHGLYLENEDFPKQYSLSNDRNQVPLFNAIEQSWLVAIHLEAIWRFLFSCISYATKTDLMCIEISFRKYFSTRPTENLWEHRWTQNWELIVIRGALRSVELKGLFWYIDLSGSNCKQDERLGHGKRGVDSIREDI